ncbi:MAG: transglycosylase SLT domain-containing protein [Desulfotalea sp.]
MNKSILLTIAFTLLFANSSQAVLKNYVNKYRGQKPPSIALKRIISYDHLIQYYSQFAYIKPHYKVNPNFIKALIMAESAANPDAVSNKAAFGLGQIILSTGKLAGRELAATGFSCKYVSNEKLKNITKKDLFRPAINILLTYYLIAKYNILFDGRIELVVSAWNAGEHTPALKKGKHAPYQETENLIGKVNSYFIYLLKNK